MLYLKELAQKQLGSTLQPLPTTPESTDDSVGGVASVSTTEFLPVGVAGDSDKTLDEDPSISSYEPVSQEESPESTVTAASDDPMKSVTESLIDKYTAGELDPTDKMRLEKVLTPRLTKYIPKDHPPTPKQAAFLLLDCKEGFYGGAAGGGKSDALLMAALQYVDVPGYAAILFRRTFADLTLPGALIDRAQTWLANTDAVWSDKLKTFRFPSGATVSFGYIEHENDKFRYQGSEFQFIGFDELTHFSETSFRYMFSRLRRLKGSPIPLRVRAASNPGGIGHEWVKQHFLIEGPEKGRIFIPAKMEDNPHLDQQGYEESLAELDPVTRAQLRNGNWDVKTDYGIFDRQWFEVIDRLPAHRYYRFVRYWDLAATAVKPGKDPDYTVGMLLAESKGEFFVCDIRRVRKRPKAVEDLVKDTAKKDGLGTAIWMEQEPGSSGVNTIDHYAREVLKGFNFRGNRATGSKVERAQPVSAAAEQGNIYVIRARWNTEFFDELEAFPQGMHDDQVDGLSGSFQKLAHGSSVVSIPTIITNDNGGYWGAFA